MEVSLNTPRCSAAVGVYSSGEGIAHIVVAGGSHFNVWDEAVTTIEKMDARLRDIWIEGLYLNLAIV